MPEEPVRPGVASRNLPVASLEAVAPVAAVGRRCRAPVTRGYARPWRKSRAECEAERASAARILGDGKTGCANGVDAQGLFHYLAAQESLDAGMEESPGQPPPHRPPASTHGQPQSYLEGRGAAQAAIDSLRQVATNASPAEEVRAAENVVAQALEALGIQDSFRLRLHRPPVGRGDVCHLILPRLWLGGVTALNNGCEELRRRRVTHVLSVLSADKRVLPDFIRGHLHIHQDDKEQASAALAAHFPRICHFIDGARSEPRGCVYVHCGAGISRAPTCVASYVMWKLGVPAAGALRLIKRARPAIRPNLGFVSELKAWEATVQDLQRETCAGIGKSSISVEHPVETPHGRLSEISTCQRNPQAAAPLKRG